MMICANCLVVLEVQEIGVNVAMHSSAVKAADLLECPKCGARILTGFGSYRNPDMAKAVVNREIMQNRRLFLFQEKREVKPETEV